MALRPASRSVEQPLGGNRTGSGRWREEARRRCRAGIVAHAGRLADERYLYDPGTRLIGQSGTGVWATTVYDSMGNTTLKWNQWAAPSKIAYDAASWLVTLVVGSRTTIYVFDRNGRGTAGRGCIAATGCSFGKENRMRRVQHSDGLLWACV